MSWCERECKKIVLSCLRRTNNESEQKEGIGEREDCEGEQREDRDREKRDERELS